MNNPAKKELLRAEGISKQYQGIHALKSVSVTLFAGEVHALMGENGAGKSTLGRILAGVTTPDSGSLLIEGQRVEFDSPREAQRLGIAMIFQELDLFPEISVAENMVIGNLHYPEGAMVPRERMEAFCRPFLQDVGLSIDSVKLVRELSMAQMQLVAIARALSMQARLIVMDEPTSSLTDDAAGRLFELIGALKAKGVAIVYVSHKMDEIFKLCDRLTVLRDGEVVGSRAREETDRSELIRMMVGRDIDLGDSIKLQPSDEVLLRVDRLSTNFLKEISFEVRRGEVLGIAGLIGAGRSEIGAALFGLDRVTGGEIEIAGRRVQPKSPKQAMNDGIGLVPEDRKLEGLMMQMSVLENVTLAVLWNMSRAGLIDKSAERERMQRVQQSLRLKCASAGDAVSTLSGGNQQKALLARWLLLDPDALFLDDPARGIDVGAKHDIYRMIESLSAKRKAIVLVSSELPELLRCSHRILVLNDGRVTALFDAAEATQESILAAATRTYAP